MATLTNVSGNEFTSSTSVGSDTNGNRVFPLASITASYSGQQFTFDVYGDVDTSQNVSAITEIGITTAVGRAYFFINAQGQLYRILNAANNDSLLISYSSAGATISEVDSSGNVGMTATATLPAQSARKAKTQQVRRSPMSLQTGINFASFGAALALVGSIMEVGLSLIGNTALAAAATAVVVYVGIPLTILGVVSTGIALAGQTWQTLVNSFVHLVAISSSQADELPFYGPSNLPVPIEPSATPTSSPTSSPSPSASQSPSPNQSQIPDEVNLILNPDDTIVSQHIALGATVITVTVITTGAENAGTVTQTAVFSHPRDGTLSLEVVSNPPTGLFELELDATAAQSLWSYQTTDTGANTNSSSTTLPYAQLLFSSQNRLTNAENVIAAWQ